MRERTIKLLSLFNENKIQILHYLYACKGDICGCEMVEKLNIPKNLLSYHIKTLRDAGFIDEVRCGKRKKYQLSPVNLDKAREMLKILELI